MSRRPLHPLGEIHTFEHGGSIRELTDPDGEPSRAQLLALWRAGMLAVVEPAARNQFTKAQAAWVIDWARKAGRS